MEVINQIIKQLNSFLGNNQNFWLSFFYPLKSFLIIISFFLSLFLVWLWLRFEIKNKDETFKWKSYSKNVRDYIFLKTAKKRFKRIKEIFYRDKILAFQEINKFLEMALGTFGYQGNLEEKLESLNKNILTNYEDLKKTLIICQLINKKLENQDNIDLSEDDYLLIFHTYEVALKDLNILATEDFLVRTLE